MSTIIVMEGGDVKRKAYFRTVTYSVEQLTRGCVDETSMSEYPSTSLRRMTTNSVRMTRTSGSIEYNELNRCISLAIVGTFLLSVYLGGE